MTQHSLAITAKIVVIIVLSISLNGCASSDTEKETNSDTIQSPTSVTEPKSSTENDLFAKDMINVEGGTFSMGSNKYNNEKPMHTVKVSSFSISKYEVTQKQWREIMGSAPEELSFKGCDKCPVENVSWNDVQQFIKKLNQEIGKNYRLPSEAEWEYAAKGGNKSEGYTYAGSNDIDEVAWYNDNSMNKGENHADYGTHPIMTKKANELGLYDMSGNVSEWCEDKWHENYENAPVDGSAWIEGEMEKRILRGSAWGHPKFNCRTITRFSNPPENRSVNFGFRLAHS